MPPSNQTDLKAAYKSDSSSHGRPLKKGFKDSHALLKKLANVCREGMRGKKHQKNGTDKGLGTSVLSDRKGMLDETLYKNTAVGQNWWFLTSILLHNIFKTGALFRKHNN